MTEFYWLTSRMIRAMHLELIAEHGGLPGVRDDNLLESALARPQNLALYGNPTLADVAAAYGFGFAKNHPFLDGNKRVALVAVAVFLDLNGYDLIAEQADAVATILALAAGEIDQEGLSRWIAEHLRPRAQSAGVEGGE